MGRGLYPRAPDMRLAATQNLSDAELFYLIENGIRLTGMPGWGTGTKEGEKSSGISCTSSAACRGSRRRRSSRWRH